MKKRKYYVSWPNNEVKFDTTKPNYTQDYYLLGRRVLELVEYKELDWKTIWDRFDKWVPKDGYTPEDVKRAIQNLITVELESE